LQALALLVLLKSKEEGSSHKQLATLGACMLVDCLPLQMKIASRVSSPMLLQLLEVCAICCLRVCSCSQAVRRELMIIVGGLVYSVSHSKEKDWLELDRDMVGGWLIVKFNNAPKPGHFVALVLMLKCVLDMPWCTYKRLIMHFIIRSMLLQGQ
jgi:hypothetical protein